MLGMLRRAVATALVMAWLMSDALMFSIATESRISAVVVVVGSLNVDITVAVDRIPNRHETLIARSPFASVAYGSAGLCEYRLRSSTSNLLPRPTGVVGLPRRSMRAFWTS